MDWVWVTMSPGSYQKFSIFVVEILGNISSNLDKIIRKIFCWEFATFHPLVCNFPLFLMGTIIKLPRVDVGVCRKHTSCVLEYDESAIEGLDMTRVRLKG